VRSGHALSLLLACSTAGACGDEARDRVLVRFLSQRAIPDQADAVEVIVRSTEDSIEVGRRRYPLTGLSEFPASVELVRGDATPARVRVEGDLYLGSALVAGGGAEHDFDAGQQDDLDVALIDVPAVRSSASGVGTAMPSLVIDRPPGAVPGDLLVAMVAHDSGNTFDIPVPTGWTYESSLSDIAPYGAHTYVFWKLVAVDEADSYTFTPQPDYANDMVGGIWAVSGADPGDPVDATGAAASDAGSEACSAPSIETTVASSLVLYACARNNIATAFSPPEGMTEDWDRRSGVDSSSMSGDGAHEVRIAPGPTGPRSATGSPGDGEVGLQLAIAPAPAQAAAEPAPMRSALPAGPMLLE